MMLMTVSDLPLERIARGKVRDVYAGDGERLLLVATDRVSAYDVVMAEPIPQKGAVLTQVSVGAAVRVLSVEGGGVVVELNSPPGKVSGWVRASALNMQAGASAVAYHV